MIGLPFAMGGFGKLATYGKITAMIAAVGLPVPPVVTIAQPTKKRRKKPEQKR